MLGWPWKSGEMVFAVCVSRERSVARERGGSRERRSETKEEIEI